MRTILVDYMINEDYYNKKITAEGKRSVSIVDNNTKLLNDGNDSTDETVLHTLSTYKYSVFLKFFNNQQKQAITLPSKYKDKSQEICKLTNKNILDEFLFWCIRFEFPENMVKFLLSLLPDLRYKMFFIESFVSQYSYISLLLLNSKSEHLSSRVVHISVQLFSSETIVINALEKCNLLPIIISTLYNMIVVTQGNSTNNLLVKSKLENELKNSHLVVDPDHPILQENLYWLVISDLVNLLSHRSLSMSFLNDSNLIEIWFELISYFQTMNLNIRQFGEHLPQVILIITSF